MVVSDLVLYRWYGWAPFNKVVYLCFAVYGIAGFAWRSRPGVLMLAGGTIGSGLFFFLATNFVVWLGASSVPAPEAGLTMWEEPTTRYAYPLIRYSRDLGGLASCYAMAYKFCDIGCAIQEFSALSPRFWRKKFFNLRLVFKECLDLVTV